MTEIVAIALSGLALAVSGLTAWLTLLRPGQLRMTQPTVIFMGPDGGPRESRAASPKIFLRTLLYSTSHRGQIVESMYVSLRRGETPQNFSIWVYGDDRLARGSGLYVGPEGITCNHHFLLPTDARGFVFHPGTYSLRVFGSVTGRESRELLHEVSLVVKEEHASALAEGEAGLYFDWGPDKEAYRSHLEDRVERPLPAWLRNMIGAPEEATGHEDRAEGAGKG